MKIMSKSTLSAVLPDVLDVNLSVVFCGTAAGKKSAERKAYYAHPTNRFWRTLAATGLTPSLLLPDEFREVPRFGIGLTDLCKSESGCDHTLSRNAFKKNKIEEIIRKYAPKIIAFTSKKAASEYLHHEVEYGLLPMSASGTMFFVLPSPSGSARKYWNESHWHQLAELVKGK